MFVFGAVNRLQEKSGRHFNRGKSPTTGRVYSAVLTNSAFSGFGRDDAARKSIRAAASRSVKRPPKESDFSAIRKSVFFFGF
jgi:hypothetical protein